MTAQQTLPKHRYYARSLEAWVSQLMETYPGFDEYDLAEMIEEKTNVQVDSRDFAIIRAFYLRGKLKAWSPDVEESDE